MQYETKRPSEREAKRVDCRKEGERKNPGSKDNAHDLTPRKIRPISSYQDQIGRYESDMGQCIVINRWRRNEYGIMELSLVRYAT